MGSMDGLAEGAAGIGRWTGRLESLSLLEYKVTLIGLLGDHAPELLMPVLRGSAQERLALFQDSAKGLLIVKVGAAKPVPHRLGIPSAQVPESFEIVCRQAEVLP
jgi:hypothetical protein